MKIINFQTYRDGGTVEITTDEYIICFDERINSSTKGSLFLGYPKEDKSNILNNSNDLEQEIIEALKDYKNEFYQKYINLFIDSKTIKTCEFTGRKYKGIIFKPCKCICHSNPGTLHIVACCSNGKKETRNYI